MRGLAMLVLGGLVGGCSIGTLTFTEANNYSYGSEIEIRSVAVAPGSNPCFDWSGMTTDIRGRAFDGVVEEAYFTQMADGQAVTISKFEDNTFLQADVDEPFALNPAPSVQMACAEDFQVLNNYYTSDRLEVGEDWLVTIAELRDGPAGGFSPLMSVFVVPEQGNTNTTVALSDDDMTIEITGLDISGVPRIPVSAGTNRADWGEVTVDVYGNPYEKQDGDDLFVGRFDVETVEEIESVFLTLDTSAAEIYRGFSKSFTQFNDLSLLESASGEPFGGFTRDGIWVFGIACAKCNNPAPLLLGVLEVQ